MKMKQRLKGFTLVELVVVMALFSLIMFSVLQLLIPVSKFFVRSANFERATACMDNMKIAIEGNLKYADRVRCYVDYQPYAADPHTIHDSLSTATGSGTDYQPSADMLRHVQNFYNEFFGANKSTVDSGGRESAMTILSRNDGATYAEEALRDYIDCRGTIYVMVFDNSTPNDYKDGGNDIDSLQRYNELCKNTGKIVMYEFNFDNASGAFEAASAPYTVQPWYVNQKLYGNFDYQFILNDQDILAAGENSFDRYMPTDNTNVGDLGALDTRIDPDLITQFNPEDCTILIRAFEIKKRGGELQPDAENVLLNGSQALMRNIMFNSYSASFSMKNVLNPRGSHENANYENALLDYKIFHDAAMTGYDETRTNQEYFQDSLYAVPRYLPAFIRSNAVNGDYATLYATRPEHQEPCAGTNFAPIAASAPTTGFGEDLINSGSSPALPGFYFIYTLPETTDGFDVSVDINGNASVNDGGYLEDVNNVFNP